MKLTHTFISAAALAALTHGASAVSLWTGGHGDFGVVYEGGEFELEWHLGEDDDDAVVDGITIPEGEFEPDELQLQFFNEVTLTNSTSPVILAGIGANPGDTVYLINQNADGIVTPIVGIGTEGLLEPGVATWSEVTFTFNSNDGPGLFSLYRVENGIPEFAVSEAEGTSTFTRPFDSHEEFNWAFTAPGVYNMNFTASATRIPDNGDPSTFEMASGTFTFLVSVPEPSSALLVAGSTLGLLLRRRRN
ncbi:MAG: choice-of-anchor M domain-containing protein [Verrucomicrobiota bacterium]